MNYKKIENTRMMYIKVFFFTNSLIIIIQHKQNIL